MHGVQLSKQGVANMLPLLTGNTKVRVRARVRVRVRVRVGVGVGVRVRVRFLTLTLTLTSCARSTSRCPRMRTPYTRSSSIPY